MTGFSGIAVSMPDPSALQQATTGLSPTGANTPAADLQHEQAFADAMQRTQGIQQIDAQPALTSNGFMSNMTQRLDSIASQMRVDPSGQADIAQQQALFSGDPASAPAPQNLAAKPPEDLHELTQKALETYRSTVVYSVEAQVATNGSSTSTKTFNNLMKGS